MHHELWLTALLNQYLAGPANWIRTLIGLPAGDHLRPWTNFMAVELFVVALLVAVALFVRSRLSVDRPGTLQQTFELIVEFLADLAKDIVGHHYRKYLPYFCTVFVFILAMNLIGLVPTFESPTMFHYVPAGVALLTFIYYNVAGFRAQGPIGYLKHFCGPLWWLAWFMFPLEIISHSIRPVSLTIRLYANMLAGEQVTIGFMNLIPLLVPIVFLGLHLFVSFVQAFIFTMLSMMYVGEAVQHEEAH